MNNARTPNHFAPQEGHFEIVKHIAEKLQNNNPALNDGQTPHHSAAHKGHFQIFKYIAEYLEDKPYYEL